MSEVVGNCSPEMMTVCHVQQCAEHVSVSVLYFSESPLWLWYDGCGGDGGTGNELDPAARPASLPSEFSSTAKVLNVALQLLPSSDDTFV